MNINIVFIDGEIRNITYTGQMTYPQFSSFFFSKRYYCLNDNSEIGNMTIDTDKVKYLEIVKWINY